MCPAAQPAVGYRGGLQSQCMLTMCFDRHMDVSDTACHACRATDVQVEFVMLDPYVRASLTPNANVSSPSLPIAL